MNPQKLNHGPQRCQRARHAGNQLAWFIYIAIFNTVGILPIIYLVWCQKNRNQH